MNENRWILSDVAIISEEKKITYGELKDLCGSFEEHILSRSLILILCTNSIGCLAGYLGSLKAKHVPLLLDEETGLDVVNSFIAAYRPEYIWMRESSKSRKLEKQWKCKVFFRIEGFALLRTFCLPQKMEDNLALLLTTSGTTGNKKVVRISRENLRSNTKSICQSLNIQNWHRAITTLPMHYTFGLSVIHTHLYMGASLLVTNRSVLDKKFWSFFKMNAATSLAGVPYTYELLMRIGIEKMDLYHLRFMTQAGGRLKDNEWKFFAQYASQKKVDFYVMYGQTEATARISCLSPEDMADKRGSIGRPIPGGRLFVVDSSGRTIEEPGRRGEIVYEGPNVMMGYAEKREDLQWGDTQGFRLFTGDIGCFDEGGDFYVIGRESRFTKICGKRINLDDMECEFYKELECRVACVEYKDTVYVIYEGTLSREEQACRQLCNRYRIGQNNIVMKRTVKMPYTPSGKINYEKLKSEVRGWNCQEQKKNL